MSCKFEIPPDEHRQFSEKVSSSDHVLISMWLPQKSLLGSGEISLFVSHCGNNARLESVYYQVSQTTACFVHTTCETNFTSYILLIDVR